MSILGEDIVAFERMRADLEGKHLGKWAVFYKGKFQAVFADFDAAASEALDRFGKGPYLIRQIGAPAAVQLPGGMIFTPAHALGAGGI